MGLCMLKSSWMQKASFSWLHLSETGEFWNLLFVIFPVLNYTFAGKGMSVLSTILFQGF